MMGWACSTNGVAEICVRNLIEISKGRRQFGRPRHTWEDNIKFDIKEIGYVGVDWIDVT
jgi:hypothetical protein